MNSGWGVVPRPIIFDTIFNERKFIMASISKDKNGTKRITYFVDQKQVCIRLGNAPMKMAEVVKIHVENLLSAQAMGVSIGTETAKWLSTIPDELYHKFVQKGLAPARKIVGTLGEAIPDIIKKKSSDAKPATIQIYEQSERSLYQYFGKDRKVNTITETEAKEFGTWLAKQGSLKKSSALKQSTVYKRVQHVVAFFHVLVNQGEINHNPFVGVACKVPVDETRNWYIDEEMILKVMEYAPDAEWRLMIALWRFAGLRAVSEVLTLKWEDVIWDQKVIMVHAPKTERYGKGIRKIPFFPHIEECLRDAWEQTDEGAIYVVEKHAPLYLRGQKERTLTTRKGNIGTVFAKIILRAGIVPWPKLIHNLRASFETDLMSGKYGKFALPTIAKWLGHSVKVMLEHYGRFQKSDYDQIAEACLQVQQKKDQIMEKKETHLVPFVGESVMVPDGASWKASRYTVVEGVKRENEEERPVSIDSKQVLEITAHKGKKKKKEAPNGNLLNYPNGGHGSRTRNPLRGTSFPMRPLAIRLPSNQIHSNKDTQRNKGLLFPPLTNLANHTLYHPIFVTVNRLEQFTIRMILLRRYVTGKSIKMTSRPPFFKTVIRRSQLP